jgi:polyvinyl alcohol dehydrogenase (cytochrome)
MAAYRFRLDVTVVVVSILIGACGPEPEASSASGSTENLAGDALARAVAAAAAVAPGAEPALAPITLPDGQILDADGSLASFDGAGGIRPRWAIAGHDLLNTRSQPRERRIGRNNAGTLTPKWVFQTEGDVWATPAVWNDTLYFPDAAGNLFAVDTKTGKVVWQRKIADYTGLTNDISRTTPAVVGDVLYLGDQGGRQNVLAGASVIAVQRNTGALLWTTKVEDHPAAIITQSPVVYQDTIYVGVSSLEEQYAATVSPWVCCSFKGSMVALDKNTGAIRWKTSMLPGAETPGYAGAAVWGNTAVVDPRRGSLYITTGNNYTVPKGILDCQSRPTPAEVKSCVDAVPGSGANHFDSIVALDLRSGAIKWARSMVPFDSWNISCIFAVPGNEGNCTNPKGEDFDFGQGPTLFTVNSRGRSRQLLGAGQKSGMYWALNPDDGSTVWNTQVGPGGSLGGLEWGSATDGVRIYAAVANSGGKPWTLTNGQSTTSGFWSALDPATGKILWQTAGNPMVKSSNQGPVSVANGVVYAGTIDTAGTMFALDANTGNQLWTYASGGSVNAGAAIVDGTVYWGSGYGVRGIGLKPNNKLYAFALKEDCRRSGSCLPPVAGSGGAGGAGGAAGGGAGGAAGGGGPIPTTWTGIYTTYLGPGTIGHCSGCHNGQGRIVPLNTAAIAYQSLTSVGQINGTSSPLGIPGQSRITWLGGDMPPNGPNSAPDAAQAIIAWVAAGALNN